jgi:hypothetical protein
MKTVIVKLVVEDDDAAWAEREMEKCLENELNEFAMFAFEVKDSTKAEQKFKKAYDREAHGVSEEVPDGCLEVDK